MATAVATPPVAPEEKVTVEVTREPAPPRTGIWQAVMTKLRMWGNKLVAGGKRIAARIREWGRKAAAATKRGVRATRRGARWLGVRTLATAKYAGNLVLRAIGAVGFVGSSAVSFIALGLTTIWHWITSAITWVAAYATALFAVFVVGTFVWLASKNRGSYRKTVGKNYTWLKRDLKGIKTLHKIPEPLDSIGEQEDLERRAAKMVNDDYDDAMEGLPGATVQFAGFLDDDPYSHPGTVIDTFDTPFDRAFEEWINNHGQASQFDWQPFLDDINIERYLESMTMLPGRRFKAYFVGRLEMWRQIQGHPEFLDMHGKAVAVLWQMYKNRQEEVPFRLIKLGADDMVRDLKKHREAKALTTA